MRVKPKEGLLVRDPFTKRPLPESGRDVPDTTYWRRRVETGDVVLMESPEPTTKNPDSTEVTP